MAKRNNEQKANVDETNAVEAKETNTVEETEQKANVDDDTIKELERVKAENDVLVKTLQDLETDKLQILKEKEELEEKLQKAMAGNNNDEYIALLKQFDAKIDEYAGMRRERLRKEFITDLKEEIQRQKEHFNA